MLLKVVEITNDLITLKSAGGDPGAIGKTMGEMIPPDFEEKILDLLEKPDWFERLAGFNPLVKPHQEFFTAVRNSVLAEYEFIEGEGGDADGDDAPDGDDDPGSDDNSGAQG